MTRQTSLFAHQPASPSEIAPATSLAATLDLFAAFLASEGKSAHTIKAFRGDMKLLADFAGPVTALADLTTSKLNAYLNWMENERGVPCSRKTYARRVTTLKVYFKWLNRLNALDHDPAAAIRQRSGPAPLSNVLTIAQVEDCFAASRTLKKGAACDYRPECLFRLLYETGLKKTECGKLQLADFDRAHPKAPQLHIRHKLRAVYKERRIDLSADLLDLLDRYQKQYQLEDRLFACTTRNLEYILTDIGERAAVPFKLSFEVMRWTMALHDHLSGVADERIRAKLGLSRVSFYETADKIRRLAAQLTTPAATRTDSEDPQ